MVKFEKDSEFELLGSVVDIDGDRINVLSDEDGELLMLEVETGEGEIQIVLEADQADRLEDLLVDFLNHGEGD